MPESKEIILFNSLEEEIITSIRSLLAELDKTEDLAAIDNNRTALEELARSISLYPSILGEHRLAGASRTMESLIRSLCLTQVPDMILHIPTKAILGRGYSIAKINFFNMLRYLAREETRISMFESKLLAIISENIFTLTAEEVFISIVEDFRVQEDVRISAGFFMAHIWEYRIDLGVRSFAPILLTIWNSREKLVPHFGTMMGFSELCMLSKDTETSWFDFLQRDGLTEDEIDSIEEFIFGLTFEEILSLRRSMETRHKTSLSRREVEDLLDRPHPYPSYWSDDPREIYRSYRDRKHNSRFRARSLSPGPKKTIEEYLMLFLLSRQENIHSAVL